MDGSCERKTAVQATVLMLSFTPKLIWAQNLDFTHHSSSPVCAMGFEVFTARYLPLAKCRIRTTVFHSTVVPFDLRRHRAVREGEE